MHIGEALLMTGQNVARRRVMVEAMEACEAERVVVEKEVQMSNVLHHTC